MSSTSIGSRYPPARRSETIDVYKSESHGEFEVPDPYQWLETSTEETHDWTIAQEVLTKEYLERNLNRQLLEDDIRSNTDYAKFSAPTFQADGYWYWSFNSGLQAQSVIYRSNRKSPDFYYENNAEIFFDTNLLSEDGTLALHDDTCVFSQDAKFWAYAIYNCGSDVCTIYVRPTSAPFAARDGVQPSHNDGRLRDELRCVKFTSIVWTDDANGFIYKRYPDREGLVTEGRIDTGPDPSPTLYYHKLGNLQSEDTLVIKDEVHPFWYWNAERQGDYLIVYTHRDMSIKNLLWVADLSKNVIGPNMVWNKIVDEFEANYEVIAVDKPLFYVRTNMDASNYKVVIFVGGEVKQSRDLIPEDREALLAQIKAVNNNNFAVVYKRNVNDEIYIFSFTGDRLIRLAPDFVGTATLTGSRQQNWFYVTMTNFTCPGTIAQYDFSVDEESDRWKIRRTMEVAGLNQQDFEVRQVWFASTDGTRVPMFIVRHKLTKFDGTAPAIQFGYGGNSVSTDPCFNPSIITFLQRYGGVLAIVNIRGGGEFGEEWHLAAIKEHKSKSFDDFLMATRFLTDNKYVAPGKVALNGQSNGGFMVAACINRASEGLIGAALPEVGPHDLLRFSRFTIGRAWISDYGDPSDPHDFDFIHPISPLHNIPSNKVLPPTLILTADHDDRVVPIHSLKYAATLQYTQPQNPHPFLLKIVKKAGHFTYGKPTKMIIEIDAAKLGFLELSLGLVWKDEAGAG